VNPDHEERRLMRLEALKAAKDQVSLIIQREEDTPTLEDKLNDEIEELYSLLRVEEDEMKAMLEAYNEFSKVVAKAMQQLGYEHDLLIYGSSMNGLALRGHSDLDLSLVIKNLPEFKNGEEKSQNDKFILRQIILTINSEKSFIERFTSESAEVITTSFGYQLKLKEKVHDIDIDVFVNKIVDPFNSYLIQTYA
jgi:hypothetical protein